MNPHSPTRRRMLMTTGLAATAGLGTLAGLASCGGGGAPAADVSTSGGGPISQPPVQPKARVIVVGGGMAGATAAKYLRLWGDAVDVTLVERAPRYTSCILSSLVLTGQRTLDSLGFGYGALQNSYGVRTVFDEVRALDPVAARLTLASGTTLTADRIVLAPGIDFDDMAPLGLSDASRMPHAWKAGPETTLLAQQLAAMPAGGTVILTVPLAPYRCPPGPYERACLLADWLKREKPGARLLVLDANPTFTAEVDNFSQAFFGLHASVIDYRTNVVITGLDAAQRMVSFSENGGLSTTVRADVVNLIPRQRAPQWLADAGLLNATEGRFAGVNPLDYGSTAAPGRVHVIGDASATTQPKAGHIANQEAKVLADALTRVFAGGQPDPAPVTNSACFSTITMTEAAWLQAVFQYDAPSGHMRPVPAASGASLGWSRGQFEDMGTWFQGLMGDTFG